MKALAFALGLLSALPGQSTPPELSPIRQSITNEECGVTISVPGDWEKVNPFGHGIHLKYMDSSEFPKPFSGIRVYLNGEKEGNYEEVEKTLRRGSGDFNLPNFGHQEVQSRQPFTTASGIKGYKLSVVWVWNLQDRAAPVLALDSNFIRDVFATSEPYVFYYYFFNKHNKGVTISLMASEKIKTAEQADALILPGLKPADLYLPESILPRGLSPLP